MLTICLLRFQKADAAVKDVTFGLCHFAQRLYQHTTLARLEGAEDTVSRHSVDERTTARDVRSDEPHGNGQSIDVTLPSED